MPAVCGQVVGIVVMINKRNGDESVSVFTNMDEKVRG